MRILGLILMSVAFSGCNIQNQNSFTISFDLPENPKDTVNLIFSTPIDFEHTDNRRVVLDSLGRGDIQIDRGTYVFARVDIKGKTVPVLAYPRGELTLTGNTNDLPHSISFTGTGENANNYYADVTKIYKDHEVWNEQYYGELDSTEFLKRRERIHSQVEELNSEYFDGSISSDTVIQILRMDNEYQSLFQLFNYELFRQKQMDIDVSNMLKNQSFLHAQSLFHHLALELFLQKRILRPIWSRYDIKNSDSINYIFPKLAYNEIVLLGTSDQLKELFSAKVLYSYLSSAVLTPSVDTIYDLWKKTFPNSEYGPLLNDSYQAIRTLESGIAAPEINGITTEGDSLRLSELKGKVIYIKVWATWCAPCLQSFPDWNKLHEEFANNDDIIFLSISVDKDIDTWRNMVASRQLAGININVDSKRIRDDYLIPGIPRYLLIDQNGRLVDARASSPKEVRTQDKIMKLLE
jgi:thiol-disulfide isomerase/thioredoxin